MDTNEAKAKALLDLWNDLDTLKWCSTYSDWNRAITQVRKEIYDRIVTLGFAVEASPDQPGHLAR